MILIIIAILLIYIFIYTYIRYFHYIQPINITTYCDIVKRLNFPSFFKYYNPSGFMYKNKIYTTHRIHFQPNIFYHKNLKNKSFIGISREDNDKVIYVNVPDIANLEQYQFSKDKNYHIVGYEDIRAFIFKDMLCMLANTFAYNEKYSQMCLIKFKLDEINLEEDEMIQSKDVVLLNPSLNENRSQKNWIPFLKNNKLLLLYSLNPMIIYNCDVDTGNINMVSEGKIIPSISTSLRGGSNIVEYYSELLNKKVYICISHIRRLTYYTHLFVILEYDYPFKIIAISDEFIIDNNSLKFSEYFYINSIYNIQFISSLLLKNNNLIAFYGENDKLSKRFEISLEDMEKTIKLV